MRHKAPIRRCTSEEGALLADILGDTPETIFPCQRLRRGLCPAFLIGEPARYHSALVEALPGTLFAFGEDPDATWTILQWLPNWTSVVVAPRHTQPLATMIERDSGRAARYENALIFTLPDHVVRVSHPDVRLMTLSEAEVVASGPGGPVGAAYGSPQALLAEGCVAGAVVDRVLVARAHTSCQSPRYSDVAVATAEAWRGRGLASATASLVCEMVQQAGRMPIWSTSQDNTASQRIAQKLGFIPYAQVSYITC